MAMDWTFHENPAAVSPDRIQEILRDPGFADYFTDHMALTVWRDGAWGEAGIVPFAPFQINPAAGVLHYGQEIFEGMKAYRRDDGSIWMFRPEANARRFVTSALRMGMPVLTPEDFLGGVLELVRRDARWVPTDETQSLYIRPFMFASEAFLGVRASNEYTFCTIAAPAGPYFADGVHPVPIWLTTEYTRAAPGGTGAAKCGGNYAAAIIAQKQAYDHGCKQVLFTDAIEHRYLEELGGMNVFLVTDHEVITPSLTGSILEGVTRSSVLQIAEWLGYTPVERRITIDETIAGVRDGTVKEFFACGTAAAVTPIGELRSEAGELHITDEPGAVTMRIRDTLLGIQYGHVEDRAGWTLQIVPAA